MKTRPVLLVAVVLAVALVACAPTTMVTPQQMVTQMAFPAAFTAAMSAINSQPYPSDTGGWIVTNSDQVGGFISAELDGRHFVPFQGIVPYRGLVSIALIDRGDGTTAVNISANNLTEAQKLASAIREKLGL